MHVTNGHWISRYKNKMGPALIVTMHMGNWELGMWPVTLAGVRPAGVYRQVEESLRRSLSSFAARGAISGRPVRPRPGRRPGRDAEDRAPDHGLCAPGRPARLHLRSLRRQRHRGAVLRPSRQEHADRGDDRAAGRRAHLDRPLLADRQPRLFDVNVNELRIPRTAIRPRTSARSPRRSSAISRSGSERLPNSSCGRTVAGPKTLTGVRRFLDRRRWSETICGKIMPK